MRIEAFSEGKHLDEPEANEDQFVIVPGRGYAVIDGVTDISGRVVDGMRTGRYASRIVQRAATELICDPIAASAATAAQIDRINGALNAEYVRLGILDEVRQQPPRRFGATLTLALDLGATFRFLFVGDSGLRINETELVVDPAGLDRVTAVLRQQAYRLIAESGGDLSAQRRVSRLCSFHGVAALHPEMHPEINGRKLALLHERSIEQSRVLFPSAPLDDIRHLVDTGISGQTKFQNNVTSPFSYSVFDGFPIPARLVQVIERPRDSIRTLELFTDGYFEQGRAATVDAWEAAADEVERIDPEKVDAYPSVKGSAPRLRTDDRTLVVVRL
jgi:hypothetical protein